MTYSFCLSLHLPTAEQRVRLSANERRREYNEEQRNEYENYLEEDRDGKTCSCFSLGFVSPDIEETDTKMLEWQNLVVWKNLPHILPEEKHLYESESLKTDLCEVLKLWRLTLIQPCTNQNKTAICMKTEFSSGSWRNFMVCPQASGPRQGAWDTKPSQSVHLWWTPDWQSSLWFPVWCDIVAVTVSYPRTANYKGETGFYVLR